MLIKRAFKTSIIAVTGICIALNVSSFAFANNTPAPLLKPLNIVAPTSHKPFGNSQTTSIVNDTLVEGGKSLRMEVSEQAEKPWHAGLSSFIGGTINPSDRVEATIWLKASNVVDAGKVSVTFQLSNPPRTEFVKKTLSVTNTWAPYKVEYTAAASQEPYSTMLGMQAGFKKQTIDVGPIIVVNLGKAAP